MPQKNGSSFNVLAKEVIAQAVEDLTSKNVNHIRTAAIYLFTDRICEKNCSPDLRDASCLCCALRCDSDKIAQGIWDRLPEKAKENALTELAMAGYIKKPLSKLN